MANSLVAAYRQTPAGQADETSDYDLTLQWGNRAKQEAPELFSEFPDFAKEWSQIRDTNAPSLAGEFGTAIESGTQGLLSDIDSAAALVAHTVGLDKISEHYQGRAKMLSDLAAENAPTIPTISDIALGETGAGRFFSKDTLRYVLAKAGGMIPSVVDMVGLSAAGAALGSAAEPGLGTIAGAAEGAAEGLLDRGIIKTAIRSLVKRVPALGTEETVSAAIEGGDQKLASIVTNETKAIAGGHAGEAAAIGLGAYPMSAGSIYKETGRPDLAYGLGAVGALAGAAPVIGLPAKIARSMFPKLSAEAAQSAATDLIGQKSSELLAKLGRYGVAETAGSAGMVGMEAANIVAKNIAQGKDALAIDDADWNRLREAAIGGALASALPAALAARSTDVPYSADEPSPPSTPGGPPSQAPQPPVAPSPAPTPSAPNAAQIYRAIRAMSAEQQTARLAELAAKPARNGAEDQEFQLLSATAPTPDVSPTPQPPVAPMMATPPVPTAPDVTAAGPSEPPVDPHETTTSEPPPEKRMAPATFAFIQPMEGLGPDFEMFHLTANIPGHPEGSTVSRQTLEEAGFDVPPAPTQQAPETPMPDWVKNEMRARGLDPARPLNDVDIQQPSIVAAVRADPTLSDAQKAQILKTGSSNVSFKDAGFDSEDAFKQHYADKHVAEVFETEDEFIRRIYCSSR